MKTIQSTAVPRARTALRQSIHITPVVSAHTLHNHCKINDFGACGQSLILMIFSRGERLSLRKESRIGLLFCGWVNWFGEVNSE
jgi:hypothetical protein